MNGAECQETSQLRDLLFKTKQNKNHNSCNKANLCSPRNPHESNLVWKAFLRTIMLPFSLCHIHPSFKGGWHFGSDSKTKRGMSGHDLWSIFTFLCLVLRVAQYQYPREKKTWTKAMGWSGGRGRGGFMSSRLLLAQTAGKPPATSKALKWENLGIYFHFSEKRN